MTSPDPRSRKPKPSAELTKPIQPEGRPGHPAPKPPPGASQPAAPPPTPSIANAMVDASRRLAPMTAGGRMGPTNTAPVNAPEAIPIGTTPAPEEPTKDKDADERAAAPKKRPGRLPKKS